MREITVTIRCQDTGTAFDVTTEVTGDASTLEVMGVMAIAERQFIQAKESNVVRVPMDFATPTRAPDGAPWYAHNDGPCGPECNTHENHEEIPPYVVRAACGEPYPCEHAPDGGNHPMAADGH